MLDLVMPVYRYEHLQQLAFSETLLLLYCPGKDIKVVVRNIACQQAQILAFPCIACPVAPGYTDHFCRRCARHARHAALGLLDPLLLKVAYIWMHTHISQCKKMAKLATI